MTAEALRAPPQIEVIRASSSQQSLLANLLELYIYDFTGFHDVPLGPDGRFGYPELPLYWQHPDRFPFLIRVSGDPAGFVLVKKAENCNGPAWDIAEFFVLRAYRRQGVGTAVAHRVWNRLPGLWQVRVMQANATACAFWEQAIGRFVGERFDTIERENGGLLWRVFLFDSPAPE